MLKAIFGGQQAEAPGVPASGDITWIPFNMERTARRRPGEGEFECTMCVKKFSTLKALKEHSVAHTNLRPFSCDVCDKTFKYQSNLFEHRTIHYPTRVHFCPFCGKQIRLKGNLKKHLATHIKSKAELEREWESERPAVMPIVRRPRFANQRGVQTVEYWTDLIQRNLLLPRPPLEPLLRNLSDKLTEAIKQGEDLMEVAKSIAFESYSCPVCMLNFTDKAACEQHLSGKHADVFTDDKRNLYCGMCVRLFATDGEKELHDLIHDRVHRLEEEGDVNLDLPPFL
uniref:C2H2-type domain-containing protein n=1 Tax=Steinernema glaseri TaxID=37863 RepID=A0A1I7YPJ3_9BILA